jgi:nicotinamide mononucleotide transporter
MHLQNWWHLLLQQIGETDWLQWTAVILGVAEVLLAKANNIWLYPTGIAGTLLSIYILLHAQLYAESLLNLYYVVMSVYGWWYWIKKKDLPVVKIAYASKRDWIIVLLMCSVGFVVLAVLLKYCTPSTVPLSDAFVSATAWAGMWLLAKRRIENWILLNISNLIAVPLLFYKQLPMFALLTIFLFIIAVQGYFSWKKQLRTEVLQNAI